MTIAVKDIGMTRVKLGMEVAWVHTYYIGGRPFTYMRRGKVFAIRGDDVLVPYCSTLEQVPKSELYVMNFNKPRRSGNYGWHKLGS
jgi:hypothetical protein